MLRFLINPQFAKEVQLDRPADGWPERIFRAALYCFAGLSAIAAVLYLFLTKAEIIEKGGKVSELASILFICSFVYMLNYSVWRFVKSKIVKIAWWLLMGLAGASILFGVILT